MVLLGALIMSLFIMAGAETWTLPSGSNAETSRGFWEQRESGNQAEQFHIHILNIQEWQFTSL